MAGSRLFIRALDLEQRGNLRIPVEIEAEVCSSTVGKRKAIMTDISVEGCRLALPFSWREGTKLVITLPTIEPRGAEVRWRSAEAIGLRFHQRLSPLVVAHLIRRKADD